LVGPGLGGCNPVCEDGLVLNEERLCVTPVDTGDTATDTPTVDTAADTPTQTLGPAVLSIEFAVDNIPNTLSLELVCDGRTVLTEDAFSVRKDWILVEETVDGSPCTLTFREANGGVIPAGRIVNCSTEIATWEQGRALESDVATFTATGCIEGCTDPVADNYNAAATLDNDSCRFIYGCTDERALNYDPLATKDDGTCDFGGFGFLDIGLAIDGFPSDTTLIVTCNGYEAYRENMAGRANQSYEKRLILDGGFQCQVAIADALGDFGPGGTVSMCGTEVAAWDVTRPPRGTTGAYERQQADVFIEPCSGCTDVFASNYDETAKIDDGSCQ
jgi:hypothetical protein